MEPINMFKETKSCNLSLFEASTGKWKVTRDLLGCGQNLPLPTWNRVKRVFRIDKLSTKIAM